MQVSMQRGEGLERSITVEIPSEEINQEVETRLKKLASTVHMKGFRPGKVPYKLVYGRYASQMQVEVFNEQIENTVHTFIEQEQLRLVNVPTVEKNITQADGQTHYHFTANFEVFPDITLNSLESYTVSRPIAEVVEADIDEMLDSFRQQKQTWSVVTRPAQLKDKVITSMQMVGSDKLLKKIEKIPVILGSGAALKELETALIGAVTGETKNIALPLVSEQQMISCNVTIHEIAEPILPEFNAELVKYYEIDSGNINDLREDIRQNMEISLKEHIRNNIKWQVMNILIKAHPILLPSALVELEKEVLKKDTEKNEKRDIPATWIEEQAQHRVALRLIIGEIMHQHSIMLDVGRVQTTIQTIADSYDDPESVYKHYRDPENLKAIQNLILEDQAVDWVLTQVQIKDEPSTFQKVTKGSMATDEGKGIFLSAYPK